MLGLDSANYLAVGIEGTVAAKIVVVAVDGAPGNIGIADYQRVALCCCQLIQVLLDGILREAVADGKHPYYLGL